MMKRALSFLLAVIALVCFTAALADGSTTESEITVKGTGTVKVNPDLAVVILGVQKSGKDVAVIQGQVNAVIADITNALTDDEIGIAKNDIQTESFTIYRDYMYAEDKNAEDFTFTAMQTLRITVRDVDLAGSVIDTAFAHGANLIQDITFGLTDAGPYNDQALAQAVSDGMHKAEVIADAAGLTLPAFPKSIVEDVNAYYDRGLLVNAESAMDAAGMGASVMGGTLKVTASVVLTYEIED